jgi:hypothetical protein
MAAASAASPPGTITVRVRLAVKRRSGRKVVIGPVAAGSPSSRPRERAADAVLKALVRAFYWRKLIETGAHPTIAEVARAERLGSTYVGRLLRLTLLAPDIVEAVLDGQCRLNAEVLAERSILTWDQQRTSVSHEWLYVGCALGN